MTRAIASADAIKIVYLSQVFLGYWQLVVVFAKRYPHPSPQTAKDIIILSKRLAQIGSTPNIGALSHGHRTLNAYSEILKILGIWRGNLRY